MNGFVSTADPDGLSTAQRFDVVFVGSLFSHLPEHSFGHWLRRIAAMLTARGLLVFTTHPVNLQIHGSREFVYHDESEETAFKGLVRPLDAAHYGTTYVSELYTAEAIRNADFGHGHYARYPLAMWGTQDVYSGL